MAGARFGLQIDYSEATEAAEVLRAWRGRAAELPKHLRDQLASAAGVDVVAEPGGLAVVLSPDMRALVAELRARS